MLMEVVDPWCASLEGSWPGGWPGTAVTEAAGVADGVVVTAASEDEVATTTAGTCRAPPIVWLATEQRKV